MVATVTYRAEIVCGVPGCPWVIRVEAHTPSDGEAALRHAIEAHEQTHKDARKAAREKQAERS